MDACTCTSCATVYPIVDGIPVLINESRSLYSRAAYTPRRPQNAVPGRRQPGVLKPLKALRRRILDALPERGISIRSESNYRALARLVRQSCGRGTVLIIGGATFGQGLQALEESGVELIESDVAIGERTALICDAHDLPFADGSIDGVVAQAVLEHVADPFRCVAEIHRALRPGGFVYAETPFMQQVHGGAYDFMRFSGRGHRRLFRQFEEIRSGSGGGPAIVLAWSWEYFLLSFGEREPARTLLLIFSRLSAWWLKYLDRYIIDRPTALDGSWGFYFLGQRSEHTLSDRELVWQYQGAGQRANMMDEHGRDLRTGSQRVGLRCSRT
jgi:SAM-dependent methyltransferase